MLGLQQRIADIVMADPAVASIGSILGGSANRGSMFISLKPPAERDGLTTQQVIDRLRKNLGMVAGIRLFMFAAQDIRAGGRQSDSNYQYTLSSTDLDLLQKWAPLVAKRMETVEGINDVSSDRDPRRAAAEIVDRPQDRIEPGRQGAGYRQRTQQCILAAPDLDRLYPAQPVSSRAGNRPQIPDRSVRPRAHLCRGAGDTQIPLSAVVHYQRDLAPLAVTHTESFPSTTVSFNVEDVCRWRSRPPISSARSMKCTCRRASRQF